MGCMNTKSLASQPHIVLPGKDLDEEGNGYVNKIEPAGTALPTLLTEQEYSSQQEGTSRSKANPTEDATIIKFTSEDPSIDRQRHIVYQSTSNDHYSANYHYRTFVLPKLLARVLGTKSLHEDDEELAQGNFNQLITTQDTLAAVPISTVYNPAFDEATI